MILKDGNTDNDTVWHEILQDIGVVARYLKVCNKLLN